MIEMQAFTPARRKKSNADFDVNNPNFKKFNKIMQEMGVGCAFEDEYDLANFAAMLYQNANNSKIIVAKFSNTSYSIIIGRTIVAKIKDGKLVNLWMPNLTRVENLDQFFAGNGVEYVTNAGFPDLEVAGDEFMANARELQHIHIPKVKKFGDHCMAYAIKLKEFNAPDLTVGGEYLLYMGEEVKEFNAPNFTNIGRYTLYYNESIEKISLPKVKYLPYGFMFANGVLEEVDAANLMHVEPACSFALQEVARENREKSR